MRKLSLKELNRVSVAQFKDQPKTPVVLVLDNIRSALNVGSAFRTADAFSLEKIYLCGITAIPPHREILKTAIGATESVAWEHIDDVVELVQSLRAEGYKIFGVEQADQRSWLQDLRIHKTEKYALLFGNEVEGLDNRLMPLLDTCVEIPQFGTKHSLNISVCVGIVVWEFFRQWRFGGG